MVRAAIPHIGVRRIACGASATDADHCGAASPPPLFQAPGHDAGQRQEWKYTGTRGRRLTHRFAFDGSGGTRMRPRGRVAHYGGVFSVDRHSRYVVSFPVLSASVRRSRDASVTPQSEMASDGTDSEDAKFCRLASSGRPGFRIRSVRRGECASISAATPLVAPASIVERTTASESEQYGLARQLPCVWRFTRSREKPVARIPSAASVNKGQLGHRHSMVPLPQTGMQFARAVSRENCALPAFAAIGRSRAGVALRSLRAAAAPLRLA